MSPLLPSECPNCGHLHPNADFNAEPGPVQQERARLESELETAVDGPTGLMAQERRADQAERERDENWRRACDADAGRINAEKRADEAERALREIRLQATRKERASGLKRYLETDLEIIASKATAALEDGKETACA